MSFKKNVDHYVEQSAKNLNFTSDLLEHIKATHSLIKVNVGVEIDGRIKNFTDIIRLGQSGGFTVNPVRFERKQQ